MTTNRFDPFDPMAVVSCVLLGIALGGTLGAAILRLGAFVLAHSWRIA